MLLVLVLAPRGFSRSTPVFPSLLKPAFPNSNSIWIIVKHFIMSLWLWRPCTSTPRVLLTLNILLYFFILRLLALSSNNSALLLCVINYFLYDERGLIKRAGFHMKMRGARNVVQPSTTQQLNQCKVKHKIKRFGAGLDIKPNDCELKSFKIQLCHWN